jgi:hypothetical protein
MYFTIIGNRHLVIVKSADCFQHSAHTFVINEFLLTGWLKGVAALGPRIRLTGEVTAEVAAQLADALERMENTPQDELHDALCGCPAGGKKALCDFLRGGGFELVDGETTKPEVLQ